MYPYEDGTVIVNTDDKAFAVNACVPLPYYNTVAKVLYVS